MKMTFGLVSRQSFPQVLMFKAQNPGTLLMIEVGYKYRFFGDDAKVTLLCTTPKTYSVSNISTGSSQRTWDGLFS